jgi:hypothetical protein
MERTQPAFPALDLIRFSFQSTARLVEIQTDTWLRLTSAQARWITSWWAAYTMPSVGLATHRAMAKPSNYDVEPAAQRESVRAARQAALEDSEVAGWQQGLSPRAADERGKRRYR